MSVQTETIVRNDHRPWQADGADVRQVVWPLSDLRPNPLNPRLTMHDHLLDELTASIRAQGVLQPLLVTPDGLIVAGHRRLAAAILAGLSEVPVVVRDLTESEQLTAMLSENLQRADLTPLEEAQGYHALRQMGFSIADIARQVGVHGWSRVGERLLILQLDPLVQELFSRGELPTGLIRPLAKVTDPAKQRHLASASAKRLLSAAQIIGLVKQEKPTLQTRPERATAPAGTSRAAALARLAVMEGKIFPVSRLSEAMEGVCSVCEDCGMSEMAIVCEACALPKLVIKVLR